MAASAWKVCRDASCFLGAEQGKVLWEEVRVVFKLLNAEILAGSLNSGNTSLTNATSLIIFHSEDLL